jgi:glutaredoxin
MLKKNSFEKSIENYPLVIMTTSSCHYCTKTKEFLSKKKIDYKEISSSPVMDKYFTQKFKDYPYVPRIIHNGKFIGGFNELETKIKESMNKKKEEKILKKKYQEKVMTKEEKKFPKEEKKVPKEEKKVPKKEKKVPKEEPKKEKKVPKEDPKKEKKDPKKEKKDPKKEKRKPMKKN